MNLHCTVHLNDTSNITWKQYDDGPAVWVEIEGDGTRVGISARDPKHLRALAEAAMAAAVELEAQTDVERRQAVPA